MSIYRCDSQELRDASERERDRENGVERRLQEEGLQETVHAPEEVEQTPEDVAHAEFPDELKSLCASYTDITKEAIALLASNVWVDGGGTTVVTPTDRVMAIRAQGEESWEAYVVMASARRTVTEGGTTSEVTTLCLQTPEWCDLATVTFPSSSGADEPAAPTLWCPSICGGSELTLSVALKEVTLEGPDDSILSARGTSLLKARATIASWCGTWRPTATTATWDKVVEEDHEQRTYRIGYKLDDARGTSVTLSIGMDDHALAVEEGGRR